jgi:WbqC-like protein family
MSELQLIARDRAQGFKLSLKKEGRPWVADVQVLEHQKFKQSVLDGLLQLYRYSPGRDQARELFDHSFVEHDGLYETVVNSTTRMFEAMGLPLTSFKDTDLIPNRPDNASTWLAQLAKSAGATDYFQGLNAMRSYFDPSEFSGLRLHYQAYGEVQPLPGKASVLHHVATHGLDRTRELCSPDATQVLPYEDLV